MLPRRLKGRLQRVALKLCRGVDRLIDRASGAEGTAFLSPYLQGNFAPVDEGHFEQLEVMEGPLPPELDGAFFRVGPNPALDPTGGYHQFDGDGMVHCVAIKGGQASYCSKYVETARLRQERWAGYPVFGKIGDLTGIWGVARVLSMLLKFALGLLGHPLQEGWGPGNTSMILHAERLLVLQESDLPYLVRARAGAEGAADLETLGRMAPQLAGNMGPLGGSFTAHPKIDPETGELFFYGYCVLSQPHCWYGVADARGSLLRRFQVPLPRPILMHDFAITQDSAIFLDLPLVFSLKEMVLKGGLPFVFDTSCPSRFGVLPRYARDASAMRWFEAEPMVAFHVVNAWQEGDVIMLYLCTLKEFCSPGLEVLAGPCPKIPLPTVTEVLLDLRPGGGCSVRKVADITGDFPTVPRSLVGRKARFAYLAALDNGVRGVTDMYGLAKVDLQAADPSEALVGLVEFGPQRFGGEGFFVPGSSNSNVGAPSEDDGYLLTFVHDEVVDASYLEVFDARTMSSKPVARIRMPRRVPYGFHTLWMSESELLAQAASDAGIGAVASKSGA